MRIVIDARNDMGSGIGRYTTNLIDQLQRLDLTNQYVVLLQHKQYDAWEPQSPNFAKELVEYPIYSWQEQILLPFTLRRLKPDLVHFTAFNSPLIYGGTRITTIHDFTLVEFKNIRGKGHKHLLYELRYRVARAVLWSAIKRSRRLITPSGYVKRQLLARYGVQPTRVNVTLESGGELAAEPAGIDAFGLTHPFLLYVGNSYPNKNLPRLIEAFELVNEKRPELHLVLGGHEDYFYKCLREMARDRSNIHFVGRVSDAQLAGLYSKATAFVFPSLSEGFGLPALEAMHAGLPVLAAHATCLPEVCRDAAAYFDPLSARDIAATILRVAFDEAELRRLRAAGFERAKQFSWEKMTRETLEVYETA